MTDPPAPLTAVGRPRSSVEIARSTPPTGLATTLVLVSCLTVMAGATISPALPAMAVHFVSTKDVDLLVRLVVTTTALAVALAAPLAGVVAGRIGQRRLLIISTGLYALAGAAGLVVGSLSALIVSRVVLGIAVAGVMTTSTTLVADWFDGRRRSRMLAAQAAASGMGGAVFLAAGGALADLSWRGPFLVYALAVPVLLLVVAKVKDPPMRHSDHVRAISGSEVRFGSVKAVAVLALMFMVQIVFYTVPTQLPFHLGAVARSSASQIGLVVAWMVATQAVSSLSYPRLSRFPPLHLAAATTTLLGIGLLVVARSTGMWGVVAGLTVAALGTGLVMPNLMAWVMQLVPARTRGGWIGALVSAVFLGQFFSPIASAPWTRGTDVAGVFGAAAALAAGMTAALVVLAFATSVRSRTLTTLTARRSTS